MLKYEYIQGKKKKVRYPEENSVELKVR